MRSVGDQEVIYQPLVVGGGDELGTYRADSFICSAAVHRGLFTVSAEKSKFYLKALDS
jgi:hypothetical protein